MFIYSDIYLYWYGHIKLTLSVVLLIVLDVTIGGSLNLAPIHPFNMPYQFWGSTFLLSGSSCIFPAQVLESIIFPKSTKFLLFENSIQKPRFEDWKCSSLLGCHCFQVFGADRSRKLYIYIYLYIHICMYMYTKNHEFILINQFFYSSELI